MFLHAIAGLARDGVGRQRVGQGGGFAVEEPGGAGRFFVNDLNGPLYIVDKETKKAATYLDFNGLAGHPGIFHRFGLDQGLAAGFVSFAFDPDYARNGANPGTAADLTAAAIFVVLLGGGWSGSRGP